MSTHRQMEFTCRKNCAASSNKYQGFQFESPKDVLRKKIVSLQEEHLKQGELQRKIQKQHTEQRENYLAQQHNIWFQKVSLAKNLLKEHSEQKEEQEARHRNQRERLQKQQELVKKELARYFKM